ncbi:MAG: hypothetical protein HY215_07440 [Candidatus Rokubacteria bacterium]|nr:hypothetical protein [Candidatus Rokubacteria bacterium]
MTMGEETGRAGQSQGNCVAPDEQAKLAGGVVLPRRRLDQLARQVAALFQKAHLTDVEARYVYKRARSLGEIRGKSSVESSRPG